MATRERARDIDAPIFFQEYEVLNLLGKGGYGSVYRAKCLRSGMEVAIKMVISLSRGVERLLRILGRSSCIIDAHLQNMSSEILKSISTRFEVLGKRNGTNVNS